MPLGALVREFVGMPGISAPQLAHPARCRCGHLWAEDHDAVGCLVCIRPIPYPQAGTIYSCPGPRS